MNRRQDRIGLLFAGLCAVNGAVVPAVGKLTTAKADPLFVVTLTTIIAAIGATGVLAAAGQLSSLFNRRTIAPLIGAGFLGTAAANLLQYIGVSQASAIETVLCLQIEPVYAVLVAWIFLGQAPTRRRIVATVILLAGIALAVGTPGVSASPGVWWLLAAPICWQASHLLVLRRLVGIGPQILTAARYLYGGSILTVAWLLFGDHSQLAVLTDITGFVPAIIVQGLVLSYLGTLVWYQALVRLDLARTTAIVVPSTPLLSLIASFLILGEVPSIQQWIGLLLTVAGVMAFVTAPALTRDNTNHP